MSRIVIAALYHFVSLDNYKELRDPLLKVLVDNDIQGTLLLAREGINGTVAASQDAITHLLNWLQTDPRLKDIKVKFSYDSHSPFYRAKVKLKKEIVTMGIEGIDPNKVVGTYVKPEDWNTLISDPTVLLVDTRNEYETSVGTFANAVDPGTNSFREFPDFVNNQLDANKHRKIAMYCTGGIRCEKATAYLKEQGFEHVYHLQGGILKYLETVAKEQSLWNGECFVFDNRVTVNHALDKGIYDLCHGCRYPITEDDKTSQYYVPGVSCANCYDRLSDDQRKRFSERQKQINLAKTRGEQHIGPTQAPKVKTQ